VPLELGARLIAAGLVVPDEVEAALFMSVLRGISFARALIDRGAITERALNEELDKNGDLPATYVEADLALFEALPVGLCRRLAVVPLRRDDESGTVDAAAVDPFDPHLPMELAFHLSSPIRVFRASLSVIEDALRRAELGAPGAGTRSSRLNRPTSASLYGAPDSVGGYPASVPLPLTRKIENPDDVIPSGELAPMSEEEEEATMVRSLPSLPDPISEPATEPEPVLPLLAAKIIPSRAPPPMPPAEAAPLEAPPWGGHEGMGPMTKPSSMMGSPASTRGGSLSLGVPNVPVPNVARSYGIPGAGEAPPSSRGSFRAAPVSSRRTPIYLTPPPEAPISFPTPPPDDEDVISVKDDEIFAMDDADADRVSEREPPPPVRESAPEVSLRARPPTLRSPILFPPPPPSDEGRISDLPTGPWVAKKVLSTAPDSAPTMALPSPRNEEPTNEELRSEAPRSEAPSDLDEEVDSAPTLVRDSLDLSESDATVAVSSPSPGARAWPALRPPAAGMPPPPVPSAAMPSPLPARSPAGAAPAFRPPVAAPPSAPPVSSGPDSAPTMAISLPASSMVSTPLVRTPVSSPPSGGSYVMPPPPVGATTLDPGTITMSAPMELPPPPIPAELSAREMPEPQSAGVVMTTLDVPANPPPPPWMHLSDAPAHSPQEPNVAVMSAPRGVESAPGIEGAPGADPWAPEPLKGGRGADPWAPEPVRGGRGADPWAPEPVRGAPGTDPWAPEPVRGAPGTDPPAPRGEHDRPPESSQTLAFTAEAPQQPAGVPVLGAGSAPPESSPTLMGIGESLRTLVQPLRPAPVAAPTPAPTAPVAPEPSPPEARVTQPSPQPAPEARAPRQSIPPPAAEARAPRQSIPPPAAEARAPRQSIPPPAGEARPPRPSVPPPGAEARPPRPSVPPPAGAASPRPSVPPPALAAALRPSVPPPSLFPPDASPVLASLREAKTRDEVVDLALQGLAPIARRAAVFAVRKDSFRGWACSPSFGDQAAFRDVVIPQDQPSLLATAAAQTVYLGPLAPTPAHAPLTAVMGPGSDDVAAVAARVGGRPALILFADDLTDTLLATRRMDELARAVGDALTRLIGQRG